MNTDLQLPNKKEQKYYIIVGGDKTLSEAEFEKSKYDNFDSKIIFRNGSYRTVIEFGSYEIASKNIAAIKLKKTDAYIVNADKWCPNLTQKDTYYECD